MVGLVGQVMEIVIKNHKVLVDDEDVGRVLQHSWYLEKSNYHSYFRSRINGKLIRLHRFIINPKPDEQVDHINGNTFDNRKSNLRVCTARQNSRNMKKHVDNHSGFKGVYFRPKQPKKPWAVYIKTEISTKYLGSYPTKEQAAEAYNKAAIELYGEYAKLNELK